MVWIANTAGGARRLAAGLAAAVLSVSLGACAAGGGGNAAPAEAPLAAGTPDPARPGVLLYDGYAAAVAREGDTVQSVAKRTGVPAGTLASYNGLRENSALRPGDELVLPPEG